MACGFPLDLNEQEKRSSSLITHQRTAGAYANHIDHYIDTETQLVPWDLYFNEVILGAVIAIRTRS